MPLRQIESVQALGWRVTRLLLRSIFSGKQWHTPVPTALEAGAGGLIASSSRPAWAAQSVQSDPDDTDTQSQKAKQMRCEVQGADTGLAFRWG